MAASSSGEKREMELPVLERDLTVLLQDETDVEHLITDLTSPRCALESLHVKGDQVQLTEVLRERLTIAVGRSKSLKSFKCSGHRSSMIDWDTLWELLKSNDVLESLDIEAVRMWSSESLCDMLRENTKLRSLRLPDAWPSPAHIKELSGVLARDAATGLQANETLRTLALTVPHFEHAKFVTNMLRTNRTIRQLAIRSNWLPSNYVVPLLEALEGNSVLLLLDLSRCHVPDAEVVFDATLKLVQTKPWLHLNLQGTDLSSGDRFPIIEQKLNQNALLFQCSDPSLRSKCARLFLCGPPGSGKTTLRQSLVRIAHYRQIQWRKPFLRFYKFFHQIKALIGKKQDGRTRGIEISELAHGNIIISIWDLAGQEEFYAFDDYMMPNLGDVVNPCSFLFVFDPIKHNKHHERNHNRRELNELKAELLHWLRFVALNTPTSTTFRPKFNVILTHADQDLDARGLCIWAESNVVNDLRKEFKNVVDISTQIHAINALSTKDVQPLFDFLFENTQNLLLDTPLVFEESARLRQVLEEEAKRNPNRPFMNWNAFCQLCAQTIPNVYYVKNKANNDERFDIGKSEERAKALAAHLHDIGDIIYVPGLEWVVVNPNWFGRDIMGYVINFENIQHFIDDTGFTSKEHIEHILDESLSRVSKHIPSGLNTSIGPDDLLKFMLHLNICYEKEPGNLEAGVFIPTILPANSSTINEGKRQLHWPIPTSLAPKETIFLGRRLESNDPIHTFLTLGFFPRLQVKLHNVFTPGAYYHLEKGLIAINFKGIEVLIEYSEKGYYIDVLVHSSLSHSDTLKIINEEILMTICQYCASSDGCRGVKLVESIIRPQCVQELTLMKYRKDQVVALKALKEEFLMANYNLNYQHTWQNVYDEEKQHDVLPTGNDLAVELLGEEAMKTLLDSQWHMLKKVSSILKIDVEESSETPNQQEEQVASIFQVKINPSMGPEYESILQNLQEQTNFLHNEFIYRVEKIIENQEAIGARIIKTVIETCAKNQNFQKQLQKELCERVNTFMKFNLQLQQRDVPRLAYFVPKEISMQSRKTLISSFVPGLECAQLHLMCEHIDGIHVVKDQKGFEVVLGNEMFQKVQPLVDKGLWILSMLLKVGAHFTTGLALEVPNLNFGSILGGAPINIPSQSRTTIHNQVATTDNQVADEWLVQTLEKVPSIPKFFDLHKVTFVTGRCEGQVAWVCGDCKAKDRSLQNIQYRHN